MKQLGFSCFSVLLLTTDRGAPVMSGQRLYWGDMTWDRHNAVRASEMSGRVVQ